MRYLSRRDFIKLSACTLGGIALAGCGDNPLSGATPIATPPPQIKPAGTRQPMRAQYALGVRRVLALGVSFPNVKPIDISTLADHVVEQAADYYAKASHGKTTLVGEVKGWYPLLRPLGDYMVSPNNFDVDRNRVRLLVEDTLNAAEKDILFDQYDHIIIVVGVGTTPGVGYGMIAYSANPGMLESMMRYGSARMDTIATRGGQRFSGGIIVVAQNAHQGHIVHDLAHALGGAIEGKRPIPDLYDTILQGKVGPQTLATYPIFTKYMGPWDVMSRHLITWEQPAPGMSSFTRLRMGWIADDQIQEIHAGDSRQVTLRPLAGGEGTLVIRIPGPGGTYYLLENRQKLPSDPILPTKGLVILHVDESREDGDGIVRVVDANNKVPDFGAAAFGIDPGQISSATLAGGAVVQVVSQQGQDLVVAVRMQ
jgi:M6 family metalloprotease-like protein